MSLATALMSGRSTTPLPCRSKIPLHPLIASSYSIFIVEGLDSSAWLMPRSSNHTAAEWVMWILQPLFQTVLALAALFLLPPLILFRSLPCSSSTLDVSSLHCLLCLRYTSVADISGVLWGVFFIVMFGTVGGMGGSIL